MAAVIARKDNVSGELFDLSIPSLNNSFGYEHIMYTIRYGISPPLEKYMEELEAIVDGPQDDKTEKRQQRLQFLYHCFESRELQDLFQIYCNYINGGGSIRSPHWFNRQYPSFFVVTVAGGNIITVFAQLITNMLDSFTKKLYSTYLSYLPEDQFSYDLKMNVDQRGSFTEFIKTPECGQVSVNISKPGITKGNHWHHSKNEKFLVVSGKGVIRFRKIDSGEVLEYFVSDDKMEVVDIPSGYTHNIENLGDTDMVTIMWANESFDPEKPDTYYLEV